MCVHLFLFLLIFWFYDTRSGFIAALSLFVRNLFKHLRSCCSVAQLCLTLCDPMDYSPPGSSVHGDSPGKNYWSGLPCPPPGDLPNPGIEPMSPALQADSLPSEPPGKPTNMMILPKYFRRDFTSLEEGNQKFVISITL